MKFTVEVEFRAEQQAKDFKDWFLDGGGSQEFYQYQMALGDVDAPAAENVRVRGERKEVLWLWKENTSLNVKELETLIENNPELEEGIRKVDSTLFKGKFQNTMDYARARLHNEHLDTLDIVFDYLEVSKRMTVRYATRCPKSGGTIKLFKGYEEADRPIECDLCSETHEGETVHTFCIVEKIEA